MKALNHITLLLTSKLKLKCLKFQDRNTDEDAVANGTFIATHLQKLKATNLDDPQTPPVEALEAPTLTPETLVAQFAARTVYAIGEASDERLTASYWLNVPSASGEDDVNDSELVRDSFYGFSSKINLIRKQSRYIHTYLCYISNVCTFYALFYIHTHTI